MNAEGLRRVKVALLTTNRLSVDLLSGCLNGEILNCEVTPINGSALKPQDLASFDLVVLGDLLKNSRPADLVSRVVALCEAPSDPPLVVISDNQDPTFILKCLQAGAKGFIPTFLSLSIARAALRLVLSGGLYIPPSALLLLDRSHETGEPTSTPEPAPRSVPSDMSSSGPASFDAADLESLGLSSREQDVLLLLRHGSSNRNIAAELGISENTVMVHVRNVMRKLGATNRTQAVFNANRLIVQHSREQSVAQPEAPHPEAEPSPGA